MKRNVKNPLYKNDDIKYLGILYIACLIFQQPLMYYPVVIYYHRLNPQRLYILYTHNHILVFLLKLLFFRADIPAIIGLIGREYQYT